ncbi:MAG: hypothetical protein QW520_05115 [Methanomassiliicoccales archaeon]
MARTQSNLASLGGRRECAREGKGARRLRRKNLRDFLGEGSDVPL